MNTDDTTDVILLELAQVDQRWVICKPRKTLVPFT